MERRAGAPPRAPGLRDELSPFYDLARMHERAGQVRVQGGVAIAVREDDEVAVAVVPRDVTGARHDPVRRCADVERAQDSYVQTWMPAVAVSPERRRDRALGGPLQGDLPPGIRMRRRSSWKHERQEHGAHHPRP